jgi:CubicO group peptidase (beta-lactamase class C family)
MFIAAGLILLMLVGCGGPSAEELNAVDFSPLPGDDWPVSTPQDQGLDPQLIAELYYNAAEMETLFGLLVVKDGQLVAEKYFNEGSIDQQVLLQSATKSYISALVGLALDQGCLLSVEQKMMDFFPEYADEISDPRKKQITIRDLLQMRSGYPWEESDPALWEAHLPGDWPPLIVGFPLVSDPGDAFHYSNLTAYWLGVIVSRACETDLRTFAEEYLFSPLDVELGEWWQDKYDYYFPFFHFSARDAARFGQLYLDDGLYAGNQILPADWVRDSLQVYSNDPFVLEDASRHLDDVGYGYQWWSARAGDQPLKLAWGHGGQLIILLPDLDMVIVTTADPFFQQHDDQAWKHEKSIINLVSEFIASLPAE